MRASAQICGRKERARIFFFFFFFFWNGQEDLELAVCFLAFFLLQVMWYTHTYSKMEILPFLSDLLGRMKKQSFAYNDCNRPTNHDSFR